jgi:very-short-patch-repair endonuclease
MLQGTPEAKRLAKRLRRKMTLPEVLLWQRLRRSPNGIKFRKQHDAGKYVLDFYCHPARTVIEVDGIVHDMGDRPFTDDIRDEWLKSLGLNVIRIPAREVLADPDAIAQAIITTCCDAAARANSC